ARPEGIHRRLQSIKVRALAIEPERLESRMANRTSIDKMLQVEPALAIITRRNDRVHNVVADAVAIKTFQHGKKDQLAGARLDPGYVSIVRARSFRAPQRPRDDVRNRGEQEENEQVLKRFNHSHIMLDAQTARPLRKKRRGLAAWPALSSGNCASF